MEKVQRNLKKTLKSDFLDYQKLMGLNFIALLLKLF